MQSGSPSVPTEVFQAIKRISALFEALMIEIVKQKGKKAMSITRIADIFFSRCGVLAKDWAFSDIIFIRFFERVAKSYLVGKAFLLQASCFITCICLNDTADVIKMVTGIYSQESDHSRISLEKCEHLFRDVLLHSATITISGVVEKFGQLEDYIEGCPLVRKFFETEDGSSEKAYISADSLQRFCIRAHPSLLWPIYMLQRQLQKFFFGFKFWDKMRRSDFCVFLKDRGVLSDAFIFCEVMSKVHISRMNIPDSKRESTALSAKDNVQTTLAYDLYFGRKTRGALGRSRRARKLYRQSEEDDIDPSDRRSRRSRSPVRRDSQSISDEHRVKFSPDNSPVSSPQTSPTSSPVASPQSSPPSSDDELDESRSDRRARLNPFISNHCDYRNFIDPYTGEIKYLRVLVIEDSQFQRKLIVRRLMKCLGEELTNYEDRWPVVSVQSGEEALRAIEQETVTPYNVFIVDENLDGGGGVLKGHEVISWLRRNQHIGNVIIIGCTANISKHGQKFLDAGANAVWAKPIPDPVILQQNIKELLLLRDGQQRDGQGERRRSNSTCIVTS